MDIQIGLYQHYKGNYYHVLGICRHSETLEELVIYQDANDTSLVWVRPKEMFQESIVHEGISIPRFQFIQSLQAVQGLI